MTDPRIQAVRERHAKADIKAITDKIPLDILASFMRLTVPQGPCRRGNNPTELWSGDTWQI